MTGGQKSGNYSYFWDRKGQSIQMYRQRQTDRIIDIKERKGGRGVSVKKEETYILCFFEKNENLLSQILREWERDENLDVIRWKIFETYKVSKRKCSLVKYQDLSNLTDKIRFNRNAA